MKNLILLFVSVMGFLVAGCTSIPQQKPTVVDNGNGDEIVTGQAFDLDLSRSQAPPGGTILILGEDQAKASPLPRVEELQKRYNAKELKVRQVVYIYPDGDEMWISVASSWGAFQSKTYWTVVLRTMQPLDLAELDPGTETGKELIRRHNERTLAVTQGRFMKKDYGLQTGDGYVPVLAGLLRDAGLVYAAHQIGGGGDNTAVAEGGNAGAVANGGPNNGTININNSRK